MSFSVLCAMSIVYNTRKMYTRYRTYQYLTSTMNMCDAHGALMVELIDSAFLFSKLVVLTVQHVTIGLRIGRQWH